MTKKRIRQMNGALRRRLTNRPAADWLPDGESFARALEAENYMQRFAPLFHGVRLRCAEVLALCRPELDALSGGQEPARGWLRFRLPPAVSGGGRGHVLRRRRCVFSLCPTGTVCSGG